MLRQQLEEVIKAAHHYTCDKSSIRRKRTIFVCVDLILRRETQKVAKRLVDLMNRNGFYPIPKLRVSDLRRQNSRAWAILPHLQQLRIAIHILKENNESLDGESRVCVRPS